MTLRNVVLTRCSVWRGEQLKLLHLLRSELSLDSACIRISNLITPTGDLSLDRILEEPSSPEVYSTSDVGRYVLEGSGDGADMNNN